MDEKNALKCLRLNPTILIWNAEPRGERTKEDLWRRPYEIWSHAESLFQTDRSEFQRTDTLTTLKRTVDRRVQHCLPMRTLVEQTATSANVWIKRLAEGGIIPENRRPSMHILMHIVEM